MEQTPRLSHSSKGQSHPGGDLNFSVVFAESWGDNAQRDILSDFFEAKLEDHNLIDIPSLKILHTWRNNRSGADSFSRRLNRYLIKERMLTLGQGYRKWVGSGGISDHRPIYLEIRGGMNKHKGPFKFNAAWLRDAEYIQLVTN